MTRGEWDEKWLDVYNNAWMSFKSHERAFRYAHDYMRARFGERPEGPEGLPLRLRLLALAGGEKMSAILKIVSRFGPLIAAFLVGLSGVIPGATPIVDGVISALGFLGIKPDAESAALFANLAASILLLYGSIVKGYKLIRAKFFPPPPPVQ